MSKSERKADSKFLYVGMLVAAVVAAFLTTVQYTPRSSDPSKVQGH